MRITLAPDQSGKLVAAVRRAGAREIGGQLFGEQVRRLRRAGTWQRQVVRRLLAGDLDGDRQANDDDEPD